MYQNLNGKIAIITGARQGMGKAEAIKLAGLGCKIVVSDISKDDCQKVVEEIEKNNGEAMAIECDVSKKSDVEKMAKETIKKFGRIDILVNNAGICQFKPFLEMAEEEFEKTININLKGYFLCAQACAKEMAKQKSGVIVNIASIAMGQVGVGFQGLTHYCASKGGIVAMAEAMALELAPLNIRVNTIAPGSIDTPMVAAVKQDMKTLEASMAGIPMKRMGTPEEIANAVAFLASDESSYMTGSVMVVDGGWIAG